MKRLLLAASCVVAMSVAPTVGYGQTPPRAGEISAYMGLHAAAWHGDTQAIRRLVAAGADTQARDGAGRTPLHVAAFASNDAAARALIEAGADANAFEHARYDALTIAAVADDLEMVRLVLELGGDPANVTSPYAGTALIAASHLGHVEVVRALLDAGAPVDHVNNLGWTALIEAVILGDGGARHTETVRALVAAGADADLADGDGMTPLDHARRRGYAAIAAILVE